MTDADTIDRTVYTIEHHDPITGRLMLYPAWLFRRAPGRGRRTWAECIIRDGMAIDYFAVLVPTPLDRCMS